MNSIMYAKSDHTPSTQTKIDFFTMMTTSCDSYTIRYSIQKKCHTVDTSNKNHIQTFSNATNGFISTHILYGLCI